MNSPRIVVVDWLDKDAEEAILTVSDGAHSLRCFAHPFHGKNGDSVTSPLVVLNAGYIVRLTNQRENVRSVSSGFEHEVIGVVVKTSPPIVKVGNLLIELDTALPRDIDVGDIVKFMADRIDYVG